MPERIVQAPQLDPVETVVATDVTMADPGASSPDSQKKMDALLSEEEKSRGQRNCPKCGTYMEKITVANDSGLPGYYCRKEGCGHTLPLPEPPPKVCRYTQVLTPSLIEMVKSGPLNEMVRAQVYSVMLRPVPASCITPDTIFDWIESCAPMNTIQLVDPATPPRRQPQFAAMVYYNYIETGTCLYQRNMARRAEFRIGNDDLYDMVGNCDSLREFVVAVTEKLTEIASDNGILAEETGDAPSISHMQPTDTQDDQYTVNDATLRDNLAEWLRRNASDTASDWDL